MLKLTGKVQDYAWGDTSSIATLQGRTPSGRPEAEVWFGAHPSAPSATEIGPLDGVIAADPVSALGEPGTLPFLVKLLAAARPLSIQAHPSIAQAREGFARENGAGIPLDAAHRNYKDDNHKPEILIALTPFKAMAGFRPVEQTVELLDELAVPELDKARQMLADDSVGAHQRLRLVLSEWLELDDPTPIVNSVLDRAAELDSFVARNLVFIGEAFPGDVGVLAALLLNHVELEPGQALFLPAGNMHAYLEGFGVEVMANSDNVLRGGLTEKHIDIAELEDIVVFEPITDPILVPDEEADDGVRCAEFPIPVPDFSVTRYSGEGSVPLEGPAIILAVAGRVALGDSLGIGPGEAAFIAAEDGEVTAEFRAADSATDFFVVRPG
ncbi:mannose-6-phosphate isomerase, class I [uncultured Corynebacterium sp.]|uniref:mannose-6-phosphate isomerase, class I n=1 Tax=uncultured Corynebacterium sp. TaxID=159447 RepID=UPI002602C020|nr:mannose-6-phosphate isomerase, class I [uncultured Corynebacterium sp.]